MIYVPCAIIIIEIINFIVQMLVPRPEALASVS